MAGPILRALSGGREGPKRVLRTGLALVHENEVVYPAAGSAAEALQAIEDAKGAVQVFFPVQVEIRAMDPADSTSTPAEAAGTAVEDMAQALDPD